MNHLRVADYEISSDLFPNTLATVPSSNRTDPLAARTTTAGAARLSDVELVALFLELPPATALKRAHDALLDTGDLRALIDLKPSKLRQLAGFTPRAISQLKASVEIGRRHLARRLERDTAITSPVKLITYFSARLRHHEREVFALLLLDNRYRPLGYEEVAHGTIDGATVHIREVVRCAITHNAAAVALAHNHPWGVATPSEADVHLTREIVKALKTIEVRVVDHIVIGDGEAVSFSQQGLIN